MWSLYGVSPVSFHRNVNLRLQIALGVSLRVNGVCVTPVMGWRSGKIHESHSQVTINYSIQSGLSLA